MAYSRRKAREEALQVLYQLDLNSGITPESALYHYENHFLAKDALVDDFARRLIAGVTGHLAELDTAIKAVSDHWRLDRMPAVDRNLLRIGAFELLQCNDIPSTVTINELVELAKLFGSKDSSAFVNGVLDKLAQNTKVPGKVP